jgi:hypothetical protein
MASALPAPGEGTPVEPLLSAIEALIAYLEESRRYFQQLVGSSPTGPWGWPVGPSLPGPVPVAPPGVRPGPFARPIDRPADQPGAGQVLGSVLVQPPVQGGAAMVPPYRSPWDRYGPGWLTSDPYQHSLWPTASSGQGPWDVPPPDRGGPGPSHGGHQAPQTPTHHAVATSSTGEGPWYLAAQAVDSSAAVGGRQRWAQPDASLAALPQLATRGEF